MLLRFFRINDPYRLLGLLILLVLLSLPFFIDPAALTFPELKNFVLGEVIGNGKRMYIEVIDYTAPVASSIFGLMDLVFGRSIVARQIIALILIFFQAAYFAILLINNKAYVDSTYVPALLFGLLCFMSFDIFTFSPELLASTLLILSLNYLFKAIEFRSEQDETILTLGVTLGVTTLIIFSYIIFLAATIFILFIFTRPSIRKVFLLLFGFILPHLLLMTLYFFRGEMNALWEGYYRANFIVHGVMWMSLGNIFFLAALPLAYFVMSIFMLNKEGRFTKYQSQLFQVMICWMLAGIVQLCITREFSARSLIIFFPSLAYLISHYLLLIKRKWLGETMLWIFVLGVYGMSIAGRYGGVSGVSYDKLFVQNSPYHAKVAGKNIMTATEDLGIYANNRMASSFLDWNLSKEILEQPDYYENVIMVHKSIAENRPDIIIDPRNLMVGFFNKMPELKAQYQRDGDLYRKAK